jgi:hypothetical protein
MMTRARRDTSTAERVYLPREGRDRVPLFHASGEWTTIRNVSEELRTRCGILVYRYQADEGYVTIDRTHLRLDHAEAIGEPCQKCWPIVEASR